MIRFLSEAESDLNAGAAWYEEQVPGLGAAFIDAVESVALRAEALPSSFQRMRGAAGRAGLRRALLSNFPWMVIFMVKDEGVVVVGVVHTARSPRVRRAASRRRVN